MVDRRIEYIPGLHGLRAFACLGVFGVHWQQHTGFGFQWGPIDGTRLLLNGNTGVAFFFMLSGFLLSREVFAPTAMSPHRRGRFFARRAARILPVYYCCLIVLVLWTGAWRSADGVRDFALHVLLLHNLRDDTFYALTPPLWTLGVQCQFYVLFGLALPWLHAVAKQISSRGLALCLLVLACGSYLAHLAVMRSADAWVEAVGLSHVISPQGPALSRSLLAHLPLFLIGAALGMAPRAETPGGRTTGRGSVRDALSLGSFVALLAILGTPLDDLLQVPYGRYNLPYVPFLLGIVLLSAPRSRFVRRFLEFGPLRTLGVLSYCFFLFHEPCLGAAAGMLSRLGATPGAWMTGAAGLALSLVVSAIVHMAVERPCLRWCNPASAYLHGPA